MYGAIPLHYACRFLQNDKMIGLFLNFPELFNYTTHDNKKAIDIAIEYNDPDVIKHFFDRRRIEEEVSACSAERKLISLLEKQYDEAISLDQSVLFFACQHLHGHKTISHLINPKSIMYRDKQTGLSPLMIAVQHRQLQSVKDLLNNIYFTKEAFELVSNASLRTVLHICAKVQYKEITTALFESRFMSNTLTLAVDALGDTPLHVCAQVGNVSMAQLLLRYVTDHNLFMTTLSNSPRYLTMTNRDSNRRFLPEASLNKTNTVTTDDRTKASRQSHLMLVKRNKGKLTPLHVAIQAGYLDVVNEMLRYADRSLLNVCDDQQRTSLHMAAAKGKKVFHLYCGPK